ncbi:MAG: phytanoyl-CoA dioxygenase family protein [Bacteroidetes bacterium]|nr:phytanoyl-CoA dioxygenase family protein [Bacteroidota bacterium]
MLQRVFQKYTGFLRSLKAVYVLNNLLNANALQHKRPLYKKYKLKKSRFSPLGSKDFSGHHHPDIPWIDQPDALQKMPQQYGWNQLPNYFQDKVPHFIESGYMILEGFFSSESIHALNTEIDQLLQAGKTDFNYTGKKIFNLFRQSAVADLQFFRNPTMLQYLQFLLGKPILPFQTLNFTLGSEQRAHSDFIHMSTEPQGYLIATWIALEDVTPDSGPLFYYPGSHRLPYLTTQHYPSGNTFFTIGSESNKRYEDAIEAQIAQYKLEKQFFLPKKGDVLIWHANLLHGGSPILRAGATRKSMVCHYFTEQVITYHEISQRPALHLPFPR